jgi:hypothetical protein
MQVYGMPYVASYHQPQRTIPWQTAPPVFGNTSARGSSLYNPCTGTIVAQPNAFNNQLTYPVQPRESQYEGPSSDPMLFPMHAQPQGATYSPHPGYIQGKEYYTSPQFVGTGQERSHPRSRAPSSTVDDANGQPMAGYGTTSKQPNCGVHREMQGVRRPSEGRGPSCAEIVSSTGKPRPPPLRAASGVQLSAGGVEFPNQHDSAMELNPMADTSNSPQMLSTNSSKSSPPYTSSQRKQLRVEEKCYLKEVKRSIAEGRVPQVRLQQDNNGNIVQYKAQFLNALKLAALAIVPYADIEVKNPSTMQEIMEEVKRQFILEKPLPEGMVAGYLQRLYKRNRAVYHRHWILHGDKGKPDDCASAAWLQLVDYWKSTEGSKECERNKANAALKKGTSVRFPAPIPVCQHLKVQPPGDLAMVHHNCSALLISLHSLRVMLHGHCRT